MSLNRKNRVLITKVGLDSHVRGAKLVAKALRDAGMEVVYLGSFQSPESIVEAALQEDVDVIGVSCHCGEHLTLVPLVLDLLKKKNIEDIPVIAGGVIPREDVPDLKAKGIADVFLTGTRLDDIVEYIDRLCASKR